MDQIKRQLYYKYLTECFNFQLNKNMVDFAREINLLVYNT